MPDRGTGTPQPDRNERPSLLFHALRQRLPYLGASWYARTPAKAGAIYVGSWSFHWTIDGPVKVKEGKVVTEYARPSREITVYHGLHTRLNVRLWPIRAYCEHGFGREAWWHRCAYVTAENPRGRPSDQELFPEDYDENGVHWSDRTCFCDLKPDYSICSMHPDEDDE